MTRRQTLLLALVVFVLLLTHRTLMSGWGPPTHPSTTPSTTFGISAYPADNLSYRAWAQQAKGGLWRFGNTVHDGKRYLVVRMCPDVKAELERRLRA